MAKRIEVEFESPDPAKPGVWPTLIVVEVNDADLAAARAAITSIESRQPLAKVRDTTTDIP